MRAQVAASNIMKAVQPKGGTGRDLMECPWGCYANRRWERQKRRRVRSAERRAPPPAISHLKAVFFALSVALHQQQQKAHYDVLLEEREKNNNILGSSHSLIHTLALSRTPSGCLSSHALSLSLSSLFLVPLVSRRHTS